MIIEALQLCVWRSSKLARRTMRETDTCASVVSYPAFA